MAWRRQCRARALARFRARASWSTTSPPGRRPAGGDRRRARAPIQVPGQPGVGRTRSRHPGRSAWPWLSGRSASRSRSRFSRTLDAGLPQGRAARGAHLLRGHTVERAMGSGLACRPRRWWSSPTTCSITVHRARRQPRCRRSAAHELLPPHGPIGRALTAFRGRGRRAIAVVGRGAGSLPPMAGPAEQTFYEIDPEVVRTASDPVCSRSCATARPGPHRSGDGRLRLGGNPREPTPHRLDALARTPFPCNCSRAKPSRSTSARCGGRDLALHGPTLPRTRAGGDALAADAGLTGTVIRDRVDDARERLEGKEPSTWVLLARHRAALGSLPALPYARPMPSGQVPTARHLWTDSFSNLVFVFHLAKRS